MNNNNLPAQQKKQGIAVVGDKKFDYAPPVYKQALEARYNSPRIKDLRQGDAKSHIADILLKMLFDSGQSKLRETDPLKRSVEKKSLEDTTVLMAESLYDDIIKTFFTVTVQEVATALNMGNKKEFENKTGMLFGGVTVINCFIWIRCYLNSEHVLDSIKKYVEAPREEYKVDKDVLEKGFALLKKNFVEPLQKADLEKRKKAAKEYKRPAFNELNQDQKWLIKFDEIHFLRPHYTKENNMGARYIKRYGKNLTVDDYLKHKALQFIYIREILSERKIKQKK